MSSTRIPTDVEAGTDALAAIAKTSNRHRERDVSDATKKFLKNLIWHIENSEVNTHIWHDGDRKSRTIHMSISEPDVQDILSALRAQS
jgi:hypothetical protein